MRKEERMKMKVVAKTMLTLLLTSVLVSLALPVKNVHAESVYMKNRTFFNVTDFLGNYDWRDSGWQPNREVSDSYTYDYTRENGERKYGSLNLISSGDHLKGNFAKSWYRPPTPEGEAPIGIEPEFWLNNRALTESILNFNVSSTTSGYGSIKAFVIVTWHVTGKLQSAGPKEYPSPQWSASASFKLEGYTYSWFEPELVAPSVNINLAEEARVEEKPIEITKTLVAELSLSSSARGAPPPYVFFSVKTSAWGGSSLGGFDGSTTSALADWDVSLTVAPDPRNPDIIVQPLKPPEALCLDLTIVEGFDKLTADGASQIKLQATARKDSIPAAEVNLVFDIEPSWLAAKAGLSPSEATTDSDGKANITFTAPDRFANTAPGFGYRDPTTLTCNSEPGAGFVRSAAFDIVVRDVEGAASATKAITIFQTSVLLVHGIRTDFTSTWEKSEGNMHLRLRDKAGFMVFPWTYEWSPSIVKLATRTAELPAPFYSAGLLGRLRQIRNEMTSLGVTSSKVDIVAHSMGGLVSRYYTRWESYENDVRKLVMIGTPHQGSPVAAGLLAQLWYLNYESLDELRPDSSFLIELNSKVPNPDVEHFVIVGTNNDLGWWEDIFVTSQPNDGDGVVSISSQSHTFPRREFIDANHLEETSNLQAFFLIVGWLDAEPYSTISSWSPVSILVTDPQGRRVGFDSNTGSILNEVPDAVYIGPAESIEQHEGILILDPLMGQYMVEAFGIAAGNFTITMTYRNATGTVLNQAEFNGTTSAGDRFEFPFVLGAPPPPPAKAFPMWIIGAGVAIAAIATAAAATLFLRKRKEPARAYKRISEI